MAVDIGRVPTFAGAKADKAQAVKVTEEAAEVFAAWQLMDKGEATAAAVVEEICDCIQALANLAAGLTWRDLRPNVAKCVTRNIERGRGYEADCADWLPPMEVYECEDARSLVGDAYMRNVELWRMSMDALALALLDTECGDGEGAAFAQGVRELRHEGDRLMKGE